MRKTIVIGLVLVVVVSVGFFVYQGNVSDGSYSGTRATASTTPVVLSDKPFTMADIAAHADGKSCYTTIRDNVYDVTSWIARHPGGAQAILSLCGKDGTSAFEGQHGGQRRPENELAGFQIGILAK